MAPPSTTKSRMSEDTNLSTSTASSSISTNGARYRQALYGNGTRAKDRRRLDPPPSPPPSPPPPPPPPPSHTPAARPPRIAPTAAVQASRHRHLDVPAASTTPCRPLGPPPAPPVFSPAPNLDVTTSKTAGDQGNTAALAAATPPAPPAPPVLRSTHDLPRPRPSARPSTDSADAMTRPQSGRRSALASCLWDHGTRFMWRLAMSKLMVLAIFCLVGYWAAALCLNGLAAKVAAVSSSLAGIVRGGLEWAAGLARNLDLTAVSTADTGAPHQSWEHNRPTIPGQALALIQASYSVSLFAARSLIGQLPASFNRHAISFGDTVLQSSTNWESIQHVLEANKAAWVQHTASFVDTCAGDVRQVERLDNALEALERENALTQLFHVKWWIAGWFGLASPDLALHASMADRAQQLINTAESYEAELRNVIIPGLKIAQGRLMSLRQDICSLSICHEYRKGTLKKEAATEEMARAHDLIDRACVAIVSLCKASHFSQQDLKVFIHQVDESLIRLGSFRGRLARSYADFKNAVAEGERQALSVYRGDFVKVVSTSWQELTAFLRVSFYGSPLD